MMDYSKYKAKAAKKPLQFWLQPFLLLFLIGLLWRLLPVSALMFNSRIIPPLPSPHVSYVKLDPAFASEVLRMSMQALRRTEFGDGNSITFETVEPFEALGPPELLEQGLLYPGKWVPGDVTPLALTLPDLLCTTKPASLYVAGDLPDKEIKMTIDPALKKSGFTMPDIQPGQLAGSGSARFYIETDDSGAVAHVLLLNPDAESAVFIEHLLYRGSSQNASSGEICIMWRNQ